MGNDSKNIRDRNASLKKPYSAPKLRVYGNIKEITKTAGTFGVFQIPVVRQWTRARTNVSSALVVALLHLQNSTLDKR
jgi:hypothetical protein